MKLSNNKYSDANSSAKCYLNTRIAGYDFARALAIFGMVAINFKYIMGAEDNGPEWFIWFMYLLDGRAAAIFVMLAGVGLSLLSRRARIANDLAGLRKNRKSLLKRAVFLFIIGMAIIKIWPADILHFYGIYIAIAAFLLSTSDQKLLMISKTFMIIFLALLFLLDYDEGYYWEITDDSGIWVVIGIIRNIFFSGYYPVLAWMTFLLFGMWLGRQDINNRSLRLKIILAGIGSILIAEISSFIFKNTFSNNTNYIIDKIQILFETKDFIPPSPLFLLSAGGTSAVIIILSIIITERFCNAKWIEPIVATGQLAMTLYVAHIVICTQLIDVFCLEGKKTLLFSTTNAIIFCVIAVIFSFFWKKRFHRGPLEFVMRWVSK